MTALDTDALVRCIVQDEVRQAGQAAKLIESHCTPESPGMVDVVVLCVLVWVLESAYGYEKNSVAMVLRQLLGVAELVVVGADQARAALRVYEIHGGDFSDQLIGIRNHAADCQITFTFDKREAASAPEMFALVQ